MALGLIELIGLSAASAALDAAAKAAEVTLAGCERVIGVDKMVSVTLCLSGEVAAVNAAVTAGAASASRIGKVVKAHVIPRPNGELKKILGHFDMLPGKDVLAEED